MNGHAIALGAVAAVCVSLFAVPRPVGAQASATPSAPATASARLVFETAAAFFSRTTNQATAIDPQVFVQDAGAGTGSGPQNVQHAAGVRNARPADPTGIVAYDASDGSLGFTVDKWFAAEGTAEIGRLPDGRDRVTASFDRLIAFGVYSLFMMTLTPEGEIFRPLDNDATTNTFTATADGIATVEVDANRSLGPDDAIVLVYHSDDMDHGLSRGLLGVDAHDQLVARMPAGALRKAL
ncbi:MAG: hypothetical protein ACREM6_14620 [Vulcanimicrobiaceae bacterium]